MTITRMAFFLVATAVLGSQTFAGEAPKELQSLCDSLCARFPARPSVTRLAILPFEDKRGGTDDGRSIAEFLITLFAREKKFSLVDRIDFQKMLSEIELGQSDLMADSGAAKAGRMLRADAICTGTVSEVFGALQITAKIIDPETTGILASASVRIGKNEVDELTKDLLNEKSKVSSAVFRSMVVPGWGQVYTDHYVRGGVSLGVFAGGTGYLIYSAIVMSDAHNTYQSYAEYLYTESFWADVRADTARTHRDFPTSTKALEARNDTLYKTYTEKYDAFLVSAAIAGGIYALNLLDAALAGAQSKRKFQLYFSGDLRQSAGVGVAIKF